MKNIHIIPTDKPSRLGLNNKVLDYAPLFGFELFDKNKNFRHNPVNIYITSDEEIKEGDWIIENHTFKREPYIGKCFYPKNDGTVTDEVLKRDLLSVNYEGHYETLARKHNCKKIILTTDQDLIKDGVQAIGDEFIELFVKNLNCESIEVCKNPFYEESNYEHYKIITPKEEPKQESIQEFIEKHGITEQQLIDGYKQGLDLIFENASKITKQETLKEAAKRTYQKGLQDDIDLSFYDGVRFGAKWQAKRMHSEEEVLIILDKFLTSMIKGEKTGLLEKWFEQFKKK